MIEKAASPLLSLERTLLRRLTTRIDTKSLSVRASNVMKNEHFVYAGDVAVETDDTLLRISNFGRKSIVEVRDAVLPPDLKLGMVVNGWPRRTLPQDPKVRSWPVPDPLHDAVIEHVIARLDEMDAVDNRMAGQKSSSRAAALLGIMRLPPAIRPLGPIPEAKDRLGILKLPPSMRAAALTRK
jgi:hypothetical protein